MTPAEQVVTLAAARPAPAGARVIGVDGRSGSGKTTFAEQVADAVAATGSPRPPLLHLDSIYPGWDGLAATPALVAAALSGLSSGFVRHPTWDWADDEPGPEVKVQVLDWLVVEGVGCGAAVVRPHLTALAWLDLPGIERRRRALARDGDTYAPHWDRWAAQEDALLTRDDIRAHADLVIATG